MSALRGLLVGSQETIYCICLFDLRALFPWGTYIHRHISPPRSGYLLASFAIDCDAAMAILIQGA